MNGRGTFEIYFLMFNSLPVNFKNLFMLLRSLQSLGKVPLAYGFGLRQSSLVNRRKPDGLLSEFLHLL